MRASRGCSGGSGSFAVTAPLKNSVSIDNGSRTYPVSSRRIFDFYRYAQRLPGTPGGPPRKHALLFRHEVEVDAEAIAYRTHRA